jgi:hypothetical protein
VSHDCDCDSCQATDSRWAPHRATQKALKDDCPVGRHVADLLRATLGEPGSAEYWCLHCRVLTDAKGRALSKYRALDEATDAAKKLIVKAIDGVMCLNHKRYKAKRKPRSTCEACWRIWLDKR